MFGLWHQWSCLSTCEWPLWNLWMAPAELMGGPENQKEMVEISKNEWSKASHISYIIENFRAL